MAGPEGPPKTDEPELDNRLATLKTRIERETQHHDQAVTAAGGTDAGTHGTSQAMSVGFRVATELVANVCVGGLIGWQLDKWLDTGPFLLLIFLGLGVASGFWSVYRIAMRPTGPRPGDRPG